MHSEIDALIDDASRPYLAAGRYAYYFARSKLRHDPVFFSLLRMGCIPDRARVLDLGCGHAVLASLMLAAQAQFESGLWPSEWTAPPSQLQLHGIESERRTALRAQTTLGDRVAIRTADLRDAPLPEADVVIMIDVLHYLEAAVHAGMAADRFGSLLTARGLPKHHHRPIEQWLHLLDRIGFEPNVESNVAEKSFANVVVWAKARGTGKA